MSKKATELLILCTSLDPKDSFGSFKIDDVCSWASKFYPASEQERNKLRCQLQHYELDVPTNLKFQNLTSVGHLCCPLAEKTKQKKQTNGGLLFDWQVYYLSIAYYIYYFHLDLVT